MAIAPAFAQDAMTPETMTCQQYSAMDQAGQMEAMAAMKSAMEGDAAATSGTEMSDSEMMSAVMTACEGNDAMSVMDAMHAS